MRDVTGVTSDQKCNFPCVDILEIRSTGFEYSTDLNVVINKVLGGIALMLSYAAGRRCARLADVDPPLKVHEFI